MFKNLIILGAGGFAREASLLVEEINDSARSINKWSLLGFIDEDESTWGLSLRGYPVLGNWEVMTAQPEDAFVICAVGDPVIKKKMVEKAENQGRPFANLIHPEVVLTDDNKVGRGILINKGCLLTTKITIGDHVSINPGCGIGHDAVIGAYSTLMWHVNISGAVEVGSGCMLGTGSTILQEKSVGSWCIIGAGAVVTNNLPDQCTAVGIPARIIKGQSYDEGDCNG